MFSAKSDAKRGKGRISRTVPIKCTDLTVCVLPSPTTLTPKPTVELELAQAGLGKKVVTIAEDCKHMDVSAYMSDDLVYLNAFCIQKAICNVVKNSITWCTFEILCLTFHELSIYR